MRDAKGTSRIDRLAALAVAIGVALLGATSSPTRAGSTTSSPEVELKGDWVEARTESFVVLGPVGPRVLDRLALDLERLRELLLHVHGVPRKATEQPTVVLIFRQADDFRRYSPWERTRGIGGFTVASPTTRYLVLDGSAGSDLAPTLFHEYVHAFLAELEADSPLWLNEGLAELYSTLRLSRERATVGLPDPIHLETLTSRAWLPLERVLTATPDSDLYSATAQGRLFYAQAWALVHYLTTDPESSHALPLLLDELRDDVPLEQAVRQALGFDLARLETEVRRHVMAHRYTTLQAPLASPEGLDSETRALPDAEILARLGDLVAGQETRDEALTRKLFEQALRLDPTQDLARRGLVRLAAGR